MGEDSFGRVINPYLQLPLASGLSPQEPELAGLEQIKDGGAAPAYARLMYEVGRRTRNIIEESLLGIASWIP